MSFLIRRDIEKKYVVDKPVLRGFNLNVAAGEIVCLLGSSGCGKTTLLRLLAGLEVVDGGELRLDGTDIRKQAPHRRRIGFMFQDHVLFPHMNVGTNIAYGWLEPRRHIRQGGRAPENGAFAGLRQEGDSRVERRRGTAGGLSSRLSPQSTPNVAG